MSQQAYEQVKQSTSPAREQLSQIGLPDRAFTLGANMSEDEIRAIWEKKENETKDSIESGLRAENDSLRTEAAEVETRISHKEGEIRDLNDGITVLNADETLQTAIDNRLATARNERRAAITNRAPVIKVKTPLSLGGLFGKSKPPILDADSITFKNPGEAQAVTRARQSTYTAMREIHTPEDQSKSAVWGLNDSELLNLTTAMYSSLYSPEASKDFKAMMATLNLADQSTRTQIVSRLIPEMAMQIAIRSGNSDTAQAEVDALRVFGTSSPFTNPSLVREALIAGVEAALKTDYCQGMQPDLAGIQQEEKNKLDTQKMSKQADIEAAQEGLTGEQTKKSQLEARIASNTSILSSPGQLDARARSQLISQYPSLEQYGTISSETVYKAYQKEKDRTLTDANYLDLLKAETGNVRLDNVAGFLGRTRADYFYKREKQQTPPNRTLERQIYQILLMNRESGISGNGFGNNERVGQVRVERFLSVQNSFASADAVAFGLAHPKFHIEDSAYMNGVDFNKMFPRTTDTLVQSETQTYESMMGKATTERQAYDDQMLTIALATRPDVFAELILAQNAQNRSQSPNNPNRVINNQGVRDSLSRMSRAISTMRGLMTSQEWEQLRSEIKQQTQKIGQRNIALEASILQEINDSFN